MSFYRDFNDKTAIAGWNTVERAPYSSIKVDSLAPTIGAEIHGVDLAQVSESQFAEIRRALDENLVVILRDLPNVSRSAQKAFASRFGGHLHRHELASSRLWDGAEFDPEFLSWRTTKDSRYTAGDAWHADVSCDASPIAYSFLAVNKLPPHGGGDTAFVNQILAYESLSDEIKQLVDGLTAIHDGAQAWTAGYGSKPEPGSNFPQTEHPVVAQHPRTGKKFLYVNPAFTSHIVQLSRHESDAILGLLYRHIERHPAFQVRVRWTPNALLIWDNWATLHHAVWDYYPNDRWGDRVSVVTGDSPRAAA